MKPAMFDYVRADSAEQAASLLQRHGEGARILAGGQSLMAVLNMRLAQPALLIDISRSTELAAIAVKPDSVRVGPVTQAAHRHAQPVGVHHGGHRAQRKVAMAARVLGEAERLSRDRARKAHGFDQLVCAPRGAQQPSEEVVRGHLASAARTAQMHRALERHQAQR